MAWKPAGCRVPCFLVLLAGLRSYGFCVALVVGTAMCYLMRLTPGLSDGGTGPKKKGNDHA